jgi:hypothetical protein
MDLRFVEETDVFRQGLFEINAVVALNTPDNDFETHEADVNAVRVTVNSHQTTHGIALARHERTLNRRFSSCQEALRRSISRPYAAHKASSGLEWRSQSMAGPYFANPTLELKGASRFQGRFSK